jgi:hypothetical protein
LASVEVASLERRPTADLEDARHSRLVRDFAESTDCLVVVDPGLPDDLEADGGWHRGL